MKRCIAVVAVVLTFVIWASSLPAFAGEADKASKQTGKSPVKVFILAGQSNMEGQAVADLEGKDYNDAKGTLNTVMKDPTKAPLYRHLKDDNGRWTVREDVWVWYKPENSPVKCGPLTLGFTVYGGQHHFGPELEFGHVMGDCLGNQVLLVKTAWGGKSLSKDFRPPSSGGEVGPYYTKMLADVREALSDLKKSFPDYDGGGYELAGFVWWHGWNDFCGGNTAVEEYEKNLVNLIKDVRADLKAPNLPVVIGELTGPWGADCKDPAALAIRKAQAGAAASPEFKGTALFVETHDFVRKPEESPCQGHGHHEFANAETYFLVGKALGEGMKRLLMAPKEDVDKAGSGSGDPNGILLKPIPGKLVVLTFDDACRSHATFVGPLLKKYGFGGTFYITEFKETFANKTQYMTWEQIKSLDDMGLEVGNHTLLHWGPKSPEEFTRQTAAIEDHCLANKIAKPTTFCWPFCSVEERAIPTLIQRGYWFARGGHNRPYKPTVDNPFDTPSFSMSDSDEKNNKDVFYNAVKQATPGQIVILLFHGVPDLEHPAVGTDPARFEEYMKYLKDANYAVISMRYMAKYIDPAKAAEQLAK